MSKEKFLRCLTPIYIAAAAFVWDQLTKLLVRSYLTLGETRPVLPCFNLTYRLNPGVAFSMLDHIKGGRYLLSAVAVIVVIFILSLFWRGKNPKGRIGKLSLGLIMGGALGNMLDRLLPPHYAVVDFIDCYWKTHHWPAFNVADSCITIGAFLLLIICLKED